MSWKIYLRLAELLITAVLALALTAAWRADRQDRAQLAAELAIAKQTLSQADTRQHDRDAQLLQTLAALAAEKRSVTTPNEIIRDLPRQLNLPVPITLQPAPPSPKLGATVVPRTEDGILGKDRTRQATQDAVIPTADLKPLYDFALDCKACQSKLAASQGDLADEKAKTATVAQERDEAIRAAKGGSLLRRVARAAKWFAIGAAAGAIAARAAH